MADVVITAENLSKRYLVGRRSAQPERYTTLRDVLAREARNFARKGFDFLRGRPIVQGDEVEEFWALRDVSFEVRRGEVLGIIGRNGAGKSTLLKILSRITEPDCGRAVLRGRVGSLLEVGTGFHPELTGRENIFLNGAVLGMTRGEIRKKFDEIVAFADVERFLETPVKRYSSGMYVRLAFAVAAHLEPEILVVDEVLAVGDAEFQNKCLGKMQDVAGHGRVVLFVSHQMAAVESLCTRAILMQQGLLKLDAAPAEVVRAYLTSTLDSGAVSIRDRRDRVSNGQGRLVGFEIIDKTGKPCTAIALREPVSFRLTVELVETLGQPLFGVNVEGIAGEPLLDLRSFHSGLRLGRTSGRLVVEVALDRVMLYPGEYSLSPWVFDNLSKVDVDWVKHCATLRVLPAAGPHGDLGLDPKYGKIHVPSRWRVVEDEGAPASKEGRQE
jgi:lipopolysaccharide transport system ATP-binding protein